MSITGSGENEDAVHAFTVPKSHQRGVAVVEEDSEPEEQEKNVPIIDSASREVEGKYWK